MIQWLVWELVNFLICNLIYFLLILITIRLIYWLYFFTKLAKYKAVYSDNDVSVSIIVCVKNNINGIKNLLPKLIKQNCNTFEVIIVDDFSNDGLEEYVSSIKDQRLRYHKCNIDKPGKKQALTEGISIAKNEWILMTDADCLPSSLDWIRWMTGSIKDKTKVVLGYGPMQVNGSLAAMFSKYETTYVAMQYFSYALKGLPYMGVGRNLLFNKSLFLSSNPYKNNEHLASGDDDFLVKAMANKENVTICLHPNAFCYSNPPDSFHDYYLQKSRHISTANHYKPLQKYLLSAFGSIHILIYFIFLANLIFNWFPLINGVGAILFMWSVMFLIQLPIFYKLKETGSIFTLPFSDTFLAMFYLFLLPKTIISKTTKWT